LGGRLVWKWRFAIDKAAAGLFRRRNMLDRVVREKASWWPESGNGDEDDFARADGAADKNSVPI
jgi:hypothetical protein